jgi:hypothetical protein
MIVFLGWIIFGLSALTIIRYASKVGGVSELPFWVGLLFVGWVYPQYLALIRDQALQPSSIEDLGTIILMTLVGILFGWKKGTEPLPHPIYSRINFADKRWSGRYGGIIAGCAGLSLFGFAMNLLLKSMDAGDLASSQWSGPITIIAFLSQATIAGFAMSLLVHLNRPSKISLFLIALNFLILAPSVLIFMRRATAGHIFIAAVLAFWFAKNWLPSRVAILLTSAVAILLVNSIGLMRPKVYADDTGKLVVVERTWEEIAEIDFVGGMFGSEATAQELRNALYSVAATRITGNYNLGANIWDGLVSSYVPAQIVGKEFKQALMIGRSAEAEAREVLFHEVSLGTTPTGFADSFQMFWFLGPIWFFCLFFAMGKLYRIARCGSLFAQALYTVCCVSALHCVTHYSVHLINSFPIFFSFLAIMFKVAAPGVPFLSKYGLPARPENSSGTAHFRAGKSRITSQIG